MSLRKPRVLLIDTDTLIYAAATNCEANHDWGDGQWSLTANLGEGKSAFRRDLKRILRQALASEFTLAISDYYNPRWREGVMPSYKHNRVQRRPLVYDELRKWVEGHPNAMVVDRIEGDDVLGVLMTDDTFMPGHEKVCVSVDKDMQQIFGLHINYQKARDTGLWEPREISVSEADHFHMFQTLTGDTIDGYKGCPGIGPVRATSVLSKGVNIAEWWPLVVAQYEMKGLTAGEALQQARVARILRREDYDSEKKEVVLWSPPRPEP